MSGKLLFSGNRLTQAVLSAARHFHLDPDQVAYVERTKSSGFLASPRAVIEVDPAAPKRTAPAPSVGAPAAQTAAPGMPVASRAPVGVSRPPISRLSEAREQELRDLATAAVEAVRASGESILMSELNPAERRIVHTTVSELGLVTESQGEERYKRILVRLGDG